MLHGVAFADSPVGPFTRHPTPLFASADSDFPGEDPFVWCQDGRYYALLKEQGSFYSDASRAIVLFESDDGLDWELSDNLIVQERELVHEDGRIQPINRLERPFLYREDGRPVVFFCGIKPKADEERSRIAAMEVLVEDR